MVVTSKITSRREKSYIYKYILTYVYVENHAEGEMVVTPDALRQGMR